jgi:Flp pilus assembly pilin Flp
MRILNAFSRDERGNTMHSVAIAAGAIALASLAGTHFLDRSVQTGFLQQAAGAKGVPSSEFGRVMASLPRSNEDGGRESLRQVTVDFTPVGSIPANLAQPIVLDPCTGIRK